MAKIKDLIAREILDSRGNPTIEVDILLDDGSVGRAAVPSGASTGSHEAVELRDGDKRYGGLGVLKAVSNINGEIKKILLGNEFKQAELDKKMIEADGTANKGGLGANATLGVSLAFAKAGASSLKIPLFEYFRQISGSNGDYILPVPQMNILNGGRHAENSTDFQEFMILPAGAPSIAEAVRYGSETFHALKKILIGKNLSTNVGDEGGYAPSLPFNYTALDVIIEAIEKAGYKPGKDIYLALDIAASEIYKDGKYELRSEGKSFSSEEFINFYNELVNKYPIISLEDGLDEDDWFSWENLTKTIGNKIQLVGDDLFVTNIERLKKGIQLKAGNAILIKPNQIGTITETIDCVKVAKEAGYNAVVSHRSGETEDTSIADLSVGLSTGQIKSGSVSRSDRTAKYNQLIHIEERLGKHGVYYGQNILKKTQGAS